jgi:hypothetical protein
MATAAWASDHKRIFHCKWPVTGEEAGYLIQGQPLHVCQAKAYIWQATWRCLMAGPNETVTVSSTLPKDLFDALVELAKKRGVSANTVLQDAIAREKYFADKENSGASILIEEKDKTLKKVTRE